mmetsp:Transcript_24836/g.59733  ORF Transcript_24836/g.59733 Transcript_24836/m.59733 type:complete len:102 (-) Transcript_24836:1306-1611(-)
MANNLYYVHNFASSFQREATSRSLQFHCLVLKKYLPHGSVSDRQFLVKREQAGSKRLPGCIPDCDRSRVLVEREEAPGIDCSCVRLNWTAEWRKIELCSTV